MSALLCGDINIAYSLMSVGSQNYHEIIPCQHHWAITCLHTSIVDFLAELPCKLTYLSDESRVVEINEVSIFKSVRNAVTCCTSCGLLRE